MNFFSFLDRSGPVDFTEFLCSYEPVDVFAFLDMSGTVDFFRIFGDF